MPRPLPTPVFHFTRVEHLGTIASSGLQCDSLAQANGLLTFEVGDAGIKARRARRAVPVFPGGFVGDYAPFYFAPRSPMMSSIAAGNVPTYTEGTEHIAYLVTTIERLQQFGLDVVLTDRNAVLDYTEFAHMADGEPADDFIDWPLMRERYWYDTPEYPDRKERRMNWVTREYLGEGAAVVAQALRNTSADPAAVPLFNTDPVTRYRLTADTSNEGS